jgi:xylulose-5-phosphate/fructose-6-phosphate phosphoketolase
MADQLDPPFTAGRTEDDNVSASTGVTLAPIPYELSDAPGPPGPGRVAPPRRVVAGGQLSGRRADLPDGQPHDDPAAAPGRRQATAPRALGDDARPQPGLRPRQPGHPAPPARRRLRHGHGGPGPNSCAWLEGTYSERYPSISRDAAGIQRFFRQFSFPGGVPRHLAPPTPGSFHEGGELDYSLLDA